MRSAKDRRPASIGDRLLVLVVDAKGKMMSLQFSDAAGTKMFMRNSQVMERAFVIGDPETPGPLPVATGYATAATLDPN